MTTRHNIDTCSLLVEFNASVWTARKLDKSTTEEVVNNKNAAAKDAARVNKHLLAGRNELEVINTFTGAVRAYVYDNTLPWSDTGIRLLPTKRFLEFNDRMGNYRDEFSDKVSDFIAIYPTLITAQAMALGDMFRRDEYPTQDEIARKFDFRLNYMPVPTSGDFRIDVGNDAQSELQEQLDRVTRERIDATVGNARARLKAHLDRMMSQLRVETVNGEVKKGKLYDTLVTGGLELCDVMEALNITNDPQIEGARVELKRVLENMDLKEIKKYDDARLDVRDKVADIMDKFNF